MCVIIYYKQNNNILIKNRDTKHMPNIQIIHEIINNIEIVYMHDILTDWIEGINEYGFSIINSSLNHKSGQLINNTNYEKE